MKKIVSLFIVVLYFLLGGCANDFGEQSDPKPPTVENPNVGIVVRASNEEAVTLSAVRSAAAEPIIFTGSDILWFNETTKELRFKDNYAKKDVFSGFRSIKFYMDGDYLFSSMIYVNSLSSQVFNSLVFYYNITENKYYLLDGYPSDTSVLSNSQQSQQLRDENRQKIESEWNRLIDQLKEEGKYQNNG
jgi:hypothetical protein